MMSGGVAEAATTWNGGNVEVTNPLATEYWASGVPTKDNPGMITDATITVSQAFNPVGTAGETLDLTLAGTTDLTVNGTFIPFTGNDGKGYLNLTLTDTAKMTVNGNFWTGSNNANNRTPIDGETYMATYTFSGNSELLVTGEWWVAMSAKTHIIIEDNAKITSKTNNSGIGWGGNAHDSLLEMKGGSVNVVNFYVAQGNSKETMTQTGGTMYTSGNFNIGNGTVIPDAKYTLSGENAKLDVDGDMVNYGVVLLDNKATAEMKTLTTYGTVVVDNGANVTIGALTNRNDFTVQGGAMVTVTGDLGIKAATTSVLENGILNVKNLLVGNSTATDGSFVVNGADAVVNAETLKLGNNDTAATMTLNAGTVTLTNVPYFGNEGAGKVTYTQTGGMLSVVGNPRVFFGYHSTGDVNINISGGEMNTGSGTLYVSDSDNTATTVNLSGTGKLVTNEVRFGQHGNAKMNLSGNSVMEANSFYMAYSYDNTKSITAELTLTDNAVMSVSGSFIPFKGFQDYAHGGKGCVRITMDGNASLTTGNFWSGSNDANNYAAPADGNEYAAYYTFSGNSKLSTAEWWVAMSAKSYVLIEENAEVTSHSGNSGLVWRECANDSLLEMTGGKLTAPNFYISNGSNYTATMDQSGGLATFGALYMTSPNADLKIRDNAVMKVNDTATNGGEIAVTGGDLQVKTLTNNASGSVQVSGGDLYATTIDNAGTMNVTGDGRIQVGTIGATAGETLTLSGANAISMNGDFVLDVFSTTDFDKLAVAEGATINFGDDAGIVLNLAQNAGFNSSEVYLIENWIDGFNDSGDWDILGSLDFSVEGIDGFVAFLNDNGGIVFGNSNAVPEPTSVILLLLGVFGMVAVRKSTKKM